MRSKLPGLSGRLDVEEDGDGNSEYDQLDEGDSDAAF